VSSRVERSRAGLTSWSAGKARAVVAVESRRGRTVVSFMVGFGLGLWFDGDWNVGESCLSGSEIGWVLAANTYTKR
jgi:hypothetical protein